MAWLWIAKRAGPDLPSPTWRTPCSSCSRPSPILDRSGIEWYSKHLIAAGELSLLPALQRGGPSPDVFRFVWLRTVHKPVIVRVETHDGGGLQVVATRLSGMGGYEPGVVEAQVKRPLTKAEERAFNPVLAATRQLTLPPVSCDWGYDGARWIVEAAHDSRYRYVERWTPSGGSLRALGMTMLGFTGWRLDPIY